MAAGADRTGDHPLALGIALHGRTELLDHAHRFMSDGQTARDRVLALQDMDVGAADGRGRDADQRIERADIGIGLSSSTIRFGSTKIAAFIIMGI